MTSGSDLVPGMPQPFGPVMAVRHRPDGQSQESRVLAEETAVALSFDGTTHAVMMATPADLEDFVLGFSLTEGIVTEPGQIADCAVIAHPDGVEARIWLAGDRGEALAARRRRQAGPVGCGLCGIDSLAAAMRPLPILTGAGPLFGVNQIAGAADALRSWQPLHDRTRAVHAAGFLLPDGGIVLAREDVGRHNALDKLVGAMARRGIDPAGGAIVLTSRVSTEMVQKCVVAGCAVLIAVSAPTLQGLRLAEAAGLTLAASARGGGFDLFCHPHRLRATAV